jgi:hypothetical protein
MVRKKHFEAMAQAADRQVERALTAGMADCWREIALSYRELGEAWASLPRDGGEVLAAAPSA